LLDADKASFVSWLAARYDRPALPNGFNKLLGNKKARRLIARLNKNVSGVYVQLDPLRELVDGESYSLNILCLVAPNRESELGAVRNVLDELLAFLGSAGVDARVTAELETRVSVATFRLY